MKKSSPICAFRSYLHRGEIFQKRLSALPSFSQNKFESDLNWGLPSPPFPAPTSAISNEDCCQKKNEKAFLSALYFERFVSWETACACIERSFFSFFFVFRLCGKCISDQKCNKNRNFAAFWLIPFCISFELAGLSAYFREMLCSIMPASNFPN